jgi:hypothetical protein
MIEPAMRIRKTALPMPIPAASTTLLGGEDFVSSEEVGVVVFTTTGSAVVFELPVNVDDVVVMFDDVVSRVVVADDDVVLDEVVDDEIDFDDDVERDDAVVVIVDVAFADVVVAVGAACADATEEVALEYFATRAKSAIQKYPAHTPPCSWSSSDPCAFVKCRMKGYVLLP